MKNKTKIIQIVYTVLIMLFLASGSFARSISSASDPDYSGAWDFYFYDASGKVVAAKTLAISDDGSISVKGNMFIDNVVYQTKISAIVSPDGKLKEGELIYLTNLEITGSMTGKFTETEGKGEWKNYQGKSGTWKATRSEKKVKDLE